ncbi:hypothetical protein V6251_12670 [Olleya sp. Ti.3.14]|uniref:hypothetical protein n=1 Tax=Olleya sp. Ti.3.14 TaxID=3121297 RepID=UPI00311D3CB7
MTFKFKAFLVEKFYKMWVVFALLLVVIIIIPGLFLSNYFLPDNANNMSLVSQLLTLSLIGIPLMIILFFTINLLFFKTVIISFNEKIIIKRNEKKLYEINPNNIKKTIIKSNDDINKKNRFKIIEFVTEKENSIKIISRDQDHEGVFNKFINAYISFYNLDIDKAKKISINDSGDYKLIFETKN